MDESLAVTRTTYRVSDFLSWQRQGNLDLRPPFQRGSVWSAKAKSFFIDTLVRGFPVPLIFLQDQTDPTTYEPKRLVVDGQQRLRTILSYIDPDSLDDFDEHDQFSVLKTHHKEIAGKTFKQLVPEIRDRILGFQFSVHVLPSTTPDKLLLETFARMNATGTKLNEQEIRNAEFSGAFKQLSYTLSYEELERWLRWSLFTKSQIARMRDVELTSELLMFLIDGFSGKGQPAIRKAYKDYDDAVPQDEALVKRFVHALDRLDEIFSDDLNEIYKERFEDSPLNTQSWMYPLFALLHDLAYDTGVTSSPKARPRSIDCPRFRKHLEARTKELRSGEIKEDLLKALRGASTDRSSRQARYDFLKRGWRLGKR